MIPYTGYDEPLLYLLPIGGVIILVFLAVMQTIAGG